MTVFSAPEVIGHRGAGRSSASDYRENSAESYLAAVGSGAQWVEIDVRRTADDALVVHHDEALPDGRTIADLPARECRDAGLLRLDEAFAAIPVCAGVDVDVKSVMEDAVDPPRRRTAGLLLPALRREAERRRAAAGREHVFVCSFDPAVLLAVREGAPEIPLAWMPFVRNPVDQAVAGAAGLGCGLVAVDARSFGLTGEPERPGRRDVAYTVGVAHRAGLDVVTWCPGPVDAARFADAGVDAVVVDDVPGVAAALKARRQKR
ncbi:glycerophosphodiester phosphodiesterase [Streptomonospora salina]|uniref:Glycerophosphoryl diester phosphodiesterase n=1 Tax=Streptomonospora salina TaxID=104205 RepID=A0A841E8A6_9ACTN|nr:glycerophosphodiester phosphodiesterase [Streptomonospora salina]MBB5999365.1 glycerophosphoryl diester phosphodiesterase [Streptomonospora salina]